MDTCIIKITGLEKFKIRDKSLWVPELTNRRRIEDLTRTERQSVHPYLRHFVLHPKRERYYQPKVEMFETLNKERNAVRYILKVEFSIPKMLYGNNLQEATEASKNTVFSTLVSSLARIGVDVSDETVAAAGVSAAHFCKNVLLPKDVRMREVLNELSRVDISKAVDVRSKYFKNGGCVLSIYSGTIERVFYDKIADAIRPKNKRTDKKHVSRERSLIDEHDLKGREMFRYEYRIKKAQTVKRDLNVALKRDGKTPVVFADLFTPDLWKTMVQTSWRTLVQRPENQLALLGATDNLSLLTHIFAPTGDTSAHSMNRAFISYGIACAIRDHGAKEVRRVVFSGRNSDHSERLTRKIEAAAALTRGLPYSAAIAYVDADLERFERITPTSLETAV